MSSPVLTTTKGTILYVFIYDFCKICKCKIYSLIVHGL